MRSVNTKFCIITFLVIFLLPNVYARQINLPTFSAQDAIDLFEEYVDKAESDIPEGYVLKVEYVDLNGDEYHQPYWSIIYKSFNMTVRPNEYEFRVYQDKSIERIRAR